MKRLLTSAAVVLGLASTPAVALDLSSMNDAERAAFGDEVRAYLLENPEVIMEAVQLLEQRQASAEAASDQALVATYAAELFDDGYSWVGGNLEGDLTLVEFVDYRCGYCRKAHDDVAALIEQDGNIRLIVKEFPILGEDSLRSSQFAVAVKQTLGADAYKLAHDSLIALKSDTSDVSLTRLAESLGFDAAPLLAHMDSDDVNAEIVRTRELAQNMRISGTPTFVMDDQLLRGYLPLENMQALAAHKRQ